MCEVVGLKECARLAVALDEDQRRFVPVANGPPRIDRCSVTSMKLMLNIRLVGPLVLVARYLLRRCAGSYNEGYYRTFNHSIVQKMCAIAYKKRA